MHTENPRSERLGAEESSLLVHLCYDRNDTISIESLLNGSRVQQTSRLREQEPLVNTALGQLNVSAFLQSTKKCPGVMQ